jgi:hypothetical protein
MKPAPVYVLEILIKNSFIIYKVFRQRVDIARKGRQKEESERGGEERRKRRRESEYLFCKRYNTKYKNTKENNKIVITII